MSDDKIRRSLTVAFVLLTISFVTHTLSGLSMSNLRSRVEALEAAGTAIVASRQ